jgi:hypothetical protein
MGRCIYCGEPAGFLRKQHKACREKHQQALAKIPEFFEKILASHLSVERFHDLLVEVAQTSFITPDNLKTVALEGTKKAALKILEQRLLTESEEDRSIAILESLGLPFDPAQKAYEILLKGSMLREMKAGKIPEHVTLTDPLPIELRSREKVLWTFNGVRSYSKGGDNKGEGENSAGDDAYLPLGKDDKKRTRTRWRKPEMMGDMLVTSVNLYLFSKRPPPQRRIALRRISKVLYHPDSIEVFPEGGKKAVRTILVDDPWFAANLISTLIHSRKRGGDDPAAA